MRSTVFQLLICLATLLISTHSACNRKPHGATGDRSPVDDNFQIYIEGNPANYIPGQQYNVSLSCANGLKFISFTLSVESANSLASGYDILGHFEIIDTAETKFSNLCENMIESTNTNSKSRIDVTWVAPTNRESGCVYIRAAVLQHRNVWFIDDGFLSKRICPEEIDEVNNQTPPVNPCCACDEAKYEIVLERKWSRNTHPKDFPFEAWRTRFSEVIGASHTFDYRFWEYGSPASLGLQELGEHGSPRTLEAEIKANLNKGNIRTIIKAPGILHRYNSLSTTLATVRVDPHHHVISLVTKIYPSPDWILGVAGLELCLANCTWIDKKILNLYPWDVGTDAGPSYMSPDQPQIPPDVVRRITSTFPNDPRSPFFDETGAQMKSLATLSITRRKLYERDCDLDEAVPLECATHPWNNWSECSSKCGAGTQFRIRSYKDPGLAESYNCQTVLRQNQNCIGTKCGASDIEQYNGVGDSKIAAECELTPWRPWSQCSKRCGKGFATRRRDFVNSYAKDNCLSGIPIELEQTKDCFGDDCGGTIQSSYSEDDEIRNIDEPASMEETHYTSPTLVPSRRPFIGSNNRQNPTQYESGFKQPPSYHRPSNVLSTNNELDADNQREHQSGREQQQMGLPNQYYFEDRGHFHSPQTAAESDPYENLNFNYNNDQNNRQPHLRNNGQNSDVRENYYGLGNKPNGLRSNYTVVQDYCFQKPTPSIKRCKLSNIVIRNYWFYDAEDQECKIFTTDNCDENKNKFTSLDGCEGTCHSPQLNLAETRD